MNNNTDRVNKELNELQKKKIEDYTHDDNLLIYLSLNDENKRVRELAIDAVFISMKQYMKNKARNEVMDRIKYTDCSVDIEEVINDVYSAGYVAVAEHIKNYVPSRGNNEDTYRVKIHNYLEPWIQREMSSEIYKELKIM